MGRVPHHTAEGDGFSNASAAALMRGQSFASKKAKSTSGRSSDGAFAAAAPDASGALAAVALSGARARQAAGGLRAAVSDSSSCPSASRAK